MSVQSLSFLVAAIITAALAVAILLRDARNRLYASFSLFNGVLFLYYLSSFVHGVSESSVWGRLTFLAALAIPLSGVRFFTIFLGQRDPMAGRAVRLSVTLAVVMAPFAFSDLVHRFPVKLVVFVFVFASLFFCMGLILERLRRTTSRVETARQKYLLFGGMVAILFSMSDFLPRVDVTWFPALGNIMTVIYLYFLSQVIIQYRLLDLNELVGKLLVLAVLVTVLATVYTLIGVFVTNVPGLIFFNTFIAGFVILILFEPITRLVEDRVNRLLFRERYEFGRQLAMLRRELAKVIDEAEMCQLILRRLEESRRVTGAAVYLLDQELTHFLRLGYVGRPPVESIDAVQERRFLERLQEAMALITDAVEAELHEVVAKSSERRLAERDALEETLRVLEAIEADVAIALISEERLIGIISLKDDRMRESYTPEEIAHLVAIGNQASICVENSRLVKSIRDRDRLAAVGEMAAGLAHEVRNPLGAIKGAAQMLTELEDGSSPAEPTEEFLEIIIEEVNRLNKVVSAFLDYAKPYVGADHPTAVNDVIGRIATLMRSATEEAGIELALSLQAELPPARIDAEVLRQVMWNLCLNALEAMEDQPLRRLSIGTRKAAPIVRLGGAGAGSEAVEISVADTGSGISEADLERIFIPFFTTKDKGTGLGLAICKRLVRAAGGDISVTSRAGQGASFTVRLPIWSEERVSVTGERAVVALR
jgi:signal transduction histidine kinase